MTLMKTRRSVVFEISWEVCNMVGGIHTVLQSKAAEMKGVFAEDYICIGPNVSHRMAESPAFREEIWDPQIKRELATLRSRGIVCRMGRWLVPGEPRCLLVGFQDVYEEKDRFLAQLWESFGVNSLFGGFDYLEPVIFSYAVGQVVERIFTQLLLPQSIQVITHAHEWMCGAALLHLHETAPEIGSVFTTHSTVLGRALSAESTDQSLHDKLQGRNIDELARSRNVESKHSLERAAALHADSFTTVSEITAAETEMILGRRAEVVPNGLAPDIPPRDLQNPERKKKFRGRLLEIARGVTGFPYNAAKTLIVVSSGRYEFSNKGFDLFLESMAGLRLHEKFPKDHKILAFMMCPRGHGLPLRFQGRPLLTTHELKPAEDPAIHKMQSLSFANAPDDRVHAIFIPLYLDGHDQAIRESYWQLLSGADFAVFPSWYEPWGYTPHEAMALGLPTVTTDLAGFGSWVAKLGNAEQTGVKVVERSRLGFGESAQEITQFIGRGFEGGTDWINALSEKALATSVKARWDEFVLGYLAAYDRALEAAQRRTRDPEYDKFRAFSMGHIDFPSPQSNVRAHVRPLQITGSFPAEIRELISFAAATLSWTWDPDTLWFFAQLDKDLWHHCDEDPVAFLRQTSSNHVNRLLADPHLAKLFGEVRAGHLKSLTAPFEPKVAYFCVEYGIADPLRIYSGGLGILAGDQLKTAADMGLPLAAFGLMYAYGYFRQFVNAEGVQEAHYHRTEMNEVPLQAVHNKDGKELILSIELGNRQVSFRAWCLKIKGVNLYLLDSDIEANDRDLRLITDRLYNADPVKRMQQEWLLSMGGLKLIEALELPLDVYHMNEGHTAFLIVGRIADLMQRHKLSFDDAAAFVRHTTLFTTHTPVEAGHDQFPVGQVLEVLAPYCESRGITVQTIIDTARGLSPGPSTNFNMTGLAARSCQGINAVSKIHRGVTQNMFSRLNPDVSPAELPIAGITNGVHIPSWLDPSWQG
ncbi:MAG: hypothetical protein C5B49_13220, partial [Bdellovibrio sp.]